MYIGTMDLMVIIKNQKDKLEYMKLKQSGNYTLLEYVEYELENKLQVDIDDVIYILSNELDQTADELQYRLKNDKDPRYLHYIRERIHFTLIELNKIKMKSEYKEMIE